MVNKVTFVGFSGEIPAISSCLESCIRPFLRLYLCLTCDGVVFMYVLVKGILLENILFE